MSFCNIARLLIFCSLFHIWKVILIHDSSITYFYGQLITIWLRNNKSLICSIYLFFQVGDMISVIDMPPPDESIWWRGKRGFEVGFFPCECVEVIGDKVPQGLNLPMGATTRLRKNSMGSEVWKLSNSSEEKKYLNDDVTFLRSYYFWKGLWIFLDDNQKDDRAKSYLKHTQKKIAIFCIMQVRV